MYSAPSKRRKSRIKSEKINLVPIMDSIFIFIFFLLMSASFVRIFEIVGNVPIISDSLDKNQPLGLTIRINQTNIELLSGVPLKLIKRFDKNPDGKYDLLLLKESLISIKKEHLREETLLIEPIADVTYEEIINIIDGARNLEKTDEAIFVKDAKGNDRRLNVLFENIMFSNIQS